MRARLSCCWIAGLMLLLLAGCGRVGHLNYLQGEFDSDAASGWPLDLVMTTGAMARVPGHTLRVQVADPVRTIDPAHSKIGKKLDANFFQNEFRPKFERNVANRMWRTGLFSDVCAASDTSPIAEPDYILKVGVTQWNKGFAPFRAYLVPPLGAARVQWEGALLDGRTKKVIFAFADARLHPGGPSPLGVMPKLWRGDQLVTEVLLESVDSLGAALRQAAGTQDQPERPAGSTRPLTRPLPPQPAPQAAPAPKAPAPKPAPVKTAPRKPAAAPARPSPVGTPAVPNF